MTARGWTRAGALPILMLAVTGFANSVAADGAHNCRHYVPGAGVTIAVDCGQPVAAVTVARAPLKCRRYIPGAGMAMEVDCQDDAAPALETPVSAAPASVAGVRASEKAKLPVEAVKGSAGKAVKPERNARADAVVDAGKAATGSCDGALDRVQLGIESDRDLKALRAGCSSGG
ncbi:MAG: hypothetical protein ABL901_13645 [Hyphomicrobiaceae bacterium]